MTSLIIIEDDAGIAELLIELLENSGYEIFSVQTANEALKYLESQPAPDLMLLDYGLPDMNGEEFIKAIKKKGHPLPPFIVATGREDERVAISMMKLGARDYIVKDINFLNILPQIVRRVDKEISNEKKFKPNS